MSNLTLNVDSLKLEDLKVGMIASFSQVDGILDTPIVMRKSSMDFSTGDPTGEIIFIGEGYAGVIDPSDSVIIRNNEDRDFWVD